MNAVLAAPPVAPPRSPARAHGRPGDGCKRGAAGGPRRTPTRAGYVLWGVLTLFAVGVVVGIGAVVAGRVFAMPHASKVGMVSLVMVFMAASGYRSFRRW